MVTLSEKNAIKAEREEKRKIRMRINDLNERKCSDCKSHPSTYCITECPITIEIRDLGIKLEGDETWTGGEGVEIPQKLAANIENYISLKEANVKDKKIANIFGIALSTLTERKKEWDVLGVKLKPGPTKKEPVKAPAPAKEKKPVGRPKRVQAAPAPDVPLNPPAQISIDVLGVILGKTNEISLEKMAQAAEIASEKVESVFTPEPKKVISMVKYQELEAQLLALEQERDGWDKIAEFRRERNDQLFKELQQQDQELLKCMELIINFQFLAKEAIEAISKSKELRVKYDNLVKLYTHGEDTKDRMIRDAAEQIRHLEAVLLDYLPDPA